MEEQNLNLKLYVDQNDFDSQKNQILKLLKTKEFLSNNLFLDQNKYITYCQSIETVKKILSKMHIYVKVNQFTNSPYLNIEEFEQLKFEVTNFITELQLVEQLNVNKLKKFMFVSKYQYYVQKINKIKYLEQDKFLLLKELNYDIEFISQNITRNDYISLKLLNRKLKLRANLLGYENFLQQKLIQLNVVDEYECKIWLNNLNNITTSLFSKIENLHFKHKVKTEEIEFTLDLQNFTLSKLFESTNENINEVFNIILQRIIFNKKTNECLSDPSIDDIILYKNENTFSSFIEFLKMISTSLHNQFSKYYNVYEYAKINEFEEKNNFYFMLLVCDVLLNLIVEDEQKLQIKNQITKILVDDVRLAFSEIYMCCNFATSSNEKNWIEAQSKFNFDEVFIDEQSLEANVIVNNCKNLTGFKTLLAIMSGIRMYQAFDKDGDLIEVIENYYKLGSLNNVKFNLSKLNIDILNTAEYDNMIKFLENR